MDSRTLRVDHELQVAPLLNSRTHHSDAAGEKQFWRVANASLQDFLQLQVVVNEKPEKMQIIALDGYPLVGRRDEEKF